MLATYTRLVSPSHSGMMSPASKGICDGRSDRIHQPPRAMMMAVGTAVPTVTSTPDPASRRHRAGEGRQRGAPEDDQHDGDQEHLVVGQVRIEHVGHGGGQEHQHGREPHDVLRPVAPHGQEAPLPAEGLPHPRVDAAVAREGGGQLGRGERHRDEVGDDRDGEEEDARPPERRGVGRFRMLSIAEMITRASPSMPSVLTPPGTPGPDRTVSDAGGPAAWPRCSGPRQR